MQKTNTNLFFEVFNSVLIRFGIRILNFFTFIIIVNSLDESNAGNYFFLISILNLFSISALSGFQDTLIRSVARKKSQFIRHSAKYNFLGSVFGSFILFVLYFVYKNETNQISLGILALAIFNPFIHGLISWKSYLLGKEEFIKFTSLEFLNSALVNTTILIFIFFFDADFLKMIIIYILYPSIINVVKTILIRKIIFKSKKGSKKYKKEINFSFKASFIDIFPTFAKEIDRLVIYSLVGPAAIVTLNTISKVPEIIKDFFKMVVRYFYPRLSIQKKYTRNLRKLFFYVDFINILLIIIFGLLIYPILFKLLFNEKFYEYILYSQILLFTIVLANNVILKNFFFKSQLDIKSYSVSLIFPSVIKIFLSIILIIKFGLTGAVISIVLYRIFNTILSEKLINN